MKRAAGFLGLLLGFAVFFGGGVALQGKILKRMVAEPNRFRDSLYLPSSDYVKLVTVGYDHFAADFLWLRVIQAFGAAFAQGESIGQLNSYFQVITDLDPHFLAAYSFGNLVLGEEAGDAKLGLGILDKGIEKNPDKYRLSYEAAFFAFWQLNDPELARGYVEKSVKASDCPEFVRTWSGYFSLKMGRYAAAYENYFREYAHSSRSGNETMIVLRSISLRRAIQDWHVAELRARAVDYFNEHGRIPTIPDLNQAGAFRDVEWPDWDRVRAYFETAAETGRAIPESEDELQKLSATFIRKGWEAMPLNPLSENPHFPGYILWPGQEPWGDALREKENAVFAMSETKAAQTVMHQLRTADRAGADSKGLGGGCPKTMAEVNPTIALHLPFDPWGGEFIWDPVACQSDITGKPGFRDLVRQYPMHM